jgi:hypothetical protein
LNWKSVTDAPQPVDFPPNLSTRLELRLLDRFRWEAYEVMFDQRSLGFVSLMSEGLWLAYREDGFRMKDLPDRQAAVVALLGSAPLAEEADSSLGSLSDNVLPNKQ